MVTNSTFQASVVRVKVLNFPGSKWHPRQAGSEKMLNFEKKVKKFTALVPVCFRLSKNVSVSQVLN